MTNNHLLIYRLAELMLEKHQHILSLDDLFEDEQIGSFVRSIQIDSPYQQLIFEGVLTETIKDEKVMVTFTVEGYFHYVLGEVIEKQTLDKGARALKELLENNKLRGITEGVEQCLVRDVEKNNLSRLMWFIDEGGKALEASAYPLAQAFLIHPIERVMDVLLANPTENDIYVVGKSITYLEKNAQYNFIEKLITSDYGEIIIRNIHLSILSFLTPKSLNFLIDKSENLNLIISAQYFLGNYQKAIDIYTNSNHKLNNNEKNIVKACYIDLGKFKESLSINANTDKLTDKLELYRLDSIANYGLGNFKKTNVLIEKAISISKIIFGSFHIKTGELYNLYGLFKLNEEKYELAEQFFRYASKIFVKSFGINSFDNAITINNIGLIYFHKKESEKAIKNWKEAINVFELINQTEHPDCVSTYHNIAIAYEKLTKFTDAIIYFEKVLNHYICNNVNNLENINLIKFNIGSCYYKLKNYKKALNYFKEGYIHLRKGGFANMIALCYEKLNEQNEAYKYNIEAAEIRKTDKGLNDSATQESISNCLRLAYRLNIENELPNWIKENH